MKHKRRDFLRMSGLTGAALAGGFPHLAFGEMETSFLPVTQENLSIIGKYGDWAASLAGNKTPTHSFRRKEWSDLVAWKDAARKRLVERLAIPDVGATPQVKINKQYNFDGLHIEELTWSLPYGRPTEAILLKPQNATGTLPGVLAFHDHGGNKYFGTRKITRTSDKLHPMMAHHQEAYYSNFAWANELAKRGYVVLVSDAFPFASRRVMLEDVPVARRNGLSDADPENPDNINAYNKWAADHETIMARSLFSAGTTWPGVFFAEDQKALDVLCQRKDVDSQRIGCGGLSGGGMRTVFMGGLDPRIKCAVCVGFMTTWKDFLLNKSYTHTWMTYVPLLPNELDFPEILGLRVPLPTLVLNDADDQLYTPPEMRRAGDILKEIYAKAGAAKNVKVSSYPGPHKFDAQMQDEAFNWFDQWLKT